MPQSLIDTRAGPVLFGASRDLAPLGEDPIDILVRCSLGHSHLVDRDRRVVSTRLSAAEENFCLRPTLTSEKRSFAKEVAEKVSRGMTVEQFHRFSKDPYSDESLDLLSSVAQARITPETTVAFDYVIAALMAEPPTNADKEFRPKSHVDQDLALYEKYKTSAKLIGHFIDWVDSQDNRIWDPAYTPSQIYNDAILAIFDSVDFVQIGKTISQDQIRIAKCAVARFIADRHRTINSAFVLLGGETGAEPEYLCDPKAVSNTLGIPIESPSPILAQLTPLDFVFVLDASDYARLAPSGFEFPYVTLNFGDENLSLSNRVAITCDEIAPKNANGNIDFKTLQRTFLYNRFVFDTAMEESDNALSSLIDFYSDPQSHSTEEHITAHKRAINGFAEHSLAEIREKIFCGLEHGRLKQPVAELLQSNWLHYKWRALTEVGERIPEKIFDEIKPLWIEAGENIAKASIKYMWALHCLSKAGFGLTKQTEARTDNSSSESPNEDLTFASDYDSSIGYSDSEMEIADPPLPFGIRDLIATTPILKSKRLLILANEDPNTWETDLDDAWEEVQIELYELMSRPEILLLEIEPETAATLSFTGSLAPASGLPIMLRHLASCPTSPLSGICLSAMANIVAAHGSALNPAEKASIIRAADTFIEGLPPDDPRYEGYKQFAQDLIIATEDL